MTGAISRTVATLNFTFTGCSIVLLRSLTPPLLPIDWSGRGGEDGDWAGNDGALIVMMAKKRRRNSGSH